VLHSIAQFGALGTQMTFDAFAGLAATFPFEEPAKPESGEFGLLVREPVGVVGAIIPWNAPMALISNKVAPALLAGCTVILKSSPEAPGEGYLLAEAAEAVGLPPGVINVITADREVSELLVRDPRVDKITFAGSTAAGRRIASICGERIARCTLELGGKSAAVILDDMDIQTAANTLSQSECFLSGQVCSSLTRIVVPRSRHDELLEALAGTFSQVRVGDPFDAQTQMGPLVASRQRDRVEGYIAKGIADGATLATGGGRPKHLERGWFVEPTVFGNVDNSSVIAQAMASTRRCSPTTSTGPARSPGSCARVPSATTRSAPTSASRSARGRGQDRARSAVSEPGALVEQLGAGGSELGQRPSRLRAEYRGAVAVLEAPGSPPGDRGTTGANDLWA